MDLSLLSLLILATLLLAAMACDLLWRRIPNMLVLYGMLLGLAFQTLAPAGRGLLQDGGLGPAAALLGAAAGLALFVPLYALRMLGAGDVKLLAMVGMWFGTSALLHATFWTFLCGGVLALAAALATGTLWRSSVNVLSLLKHAVLRASGTHALPRPAPTGRLPYGVAIAAGSGIEMVRLALLAH